jgi:hypothetical protein
MAWVWQLRIARENCNVLLSGGLHLSKFPDGRPRDILFVVWFWLLIIIFADLFRRHDISGWIKAIWVIALIVFSYFAVLAYLIFEGRGMAERNVQQAQQARDELRRVFGFSVADEIQKLDGLKKAGSISDAEFARLRARLVSNEGGALAA